MWQKWEKNKEITGHQRAELSQPASAKLNKWLGVEAGLRKHQDREMAVLDEPRQEPEERSEAKRALALGALAAIEADI